MALTISAMSGARPVLGALDPAAPAPLGRDSIVRTVVCQTRSPPCSCSVLSSWRSPTPRWSPASSTTASSGHARSAELDGRLVERLGLRPHSADLDLGRRLDTWLNGYYPRLPRLPSVVPRLPAVHVLLRRPSIGLTRRVRGVPARS